MVHYSEGETVDVGLLIAEIETDLTQPMNTASESPSAAAPKTTEAQGQEESAPAAEVSSNTQGSEGERRFIHP